MVGLRRAEFSPLTGEQLSGVGKWDLANQVLYNPIQTFVRSAIIAFILSLAQLPRAIRVNLILIDFVNWALFFSVLFSILFQCHPFHYTYDWKLMDAAAREAAGAGPDGMVDGKLVAGGSCIARAALYISTSIVGICLDLWLLAIPSALVWKMNLPKKQKAIVVIVLSAWVVLVLSLCPVFCSFLPPLLSIRFPFPRSVTADMTYPLNFFFLKKKCNNPPNHTPGAPSPILA